MNIKRFNESVNDSKKFYIFSFNYWDDTYQGSIWDSPRKPWVPSSAELIGDFELDNSNKRYFVISEKNLHDIFDGKNLVGNDKFYKDDKINNIKRKYELNKNIEKFNL